MFKPEFLNLRTRISYEKKSISKNTNISRNFECVLENYSLLNKPSEFVKEKQNLSLTLTLRTYNNLNDSSLFYKLINEKLGSKNLAFNSNSAPVILVKNTFSEKSKQKFRSFSNFSIYYESKLFTNLLEFILHKFSFHLNFHEYRNKDKLLKLTNYEEIKKRTYSSPSQTERRLIVKLKMVDSFFSNFLQSFVSQTYLKKHQTKEFRKKTFLSFNKEKIIPSTEVFLNSFYCEIWKEISCSDCSNFLNKYNLLTLELNTENFKFETLLNLFYIYIKLLLPTYFKQNSPEKKSSLFTSDSNFSKPLLLKISKKNKYNFYRFKQLFYQFYYFHFLVFSLRSCPLNFQNLLLESSFKSEKCFQVSANNFHSANFTRIEKFKTKFKFPNFIQDSETSSLTLKQIFRNNNAFLNNFRVAEKIFKNNLSFFVKVIYCNVGRRQDVLIFNEIKVFNFIKNFSILYRNFKSLKRLNTFHSNLNGFVNNRNYLNIEKLLFEILQQITLKNEKSVVITEINKNFIFYFSPLSKGMYFVCSFTNFENLEQYFLLLNFFNTWIEKNYFLNLKNLNSIYCNLLLSYNVDFFSKRKNQIFLNFKQIYNLCYVTEYLLTKNSNQNFLNLNFVNIPLDEIKKLTFIKKIKQMVKIYSSQAQENLISKLTPYILSWTYLFRFKLKKSNWNELDKILSQFIWRWACRRHNNKSKKWIQSKYFFTLNKELWFFGQMDTNSFVEPRTKDNVNFVYLPYYSQVSHFLTVSEKRPNEFK